MSNVIPFRSAPLQRYREVIKQPSTTYACARCPAVVITSAGLPDGWKRAGVYRGHKRLRGGFWCRWCVSTESDVVFEVIGGR